MTNFSFGEGGRGRKLPETLSEEEVLKLAAAVRKKRHKLAILLGFYACLRVSEVVKLLPENVDKGQRLLRVKEGKGGKDRNVPLAPQLIRVVGGLPVGVGVRALELVVKNYGRKVLGRDVHFHTLRHSGATFYLKKGLNIREVQQLLGHSSLQTTQIYTHVSPDEMIKKIWEETK